MPPALRAQAEGGHDAVIEHPAAAADPHLFRAAHACGALLGAVVPAAKGVLLLRVPADQPDESSLPPHRAPRILDLPVLRSTIAAVSREDHRVVDDCARLAVIEDARGVHAPSGSGSNRDHHGPRAVEGLEQRFRLVPRELPPTDEAELRTLAADHGDRAIRFGAERGPARTPRGQERYSFSELQRRGAARLHGGVLPLLLGDETPFGSVLHSQLGCRSLAAAAPTALLRVRHAVHELLRGELPIRLIELGVGPQDSCR
mmetsp:Transcript_116969/g.338106  ORF Transcript_116969/g.338106 Transcript_116969/m.338106 type:complete len:259 (+) Transcript_116969:216-992(+)